MKVASRLPAGGEVTVPDLLTRLTGEPPGGRLAVFDPRVVDFLAGLSGRLLARTATRRYPELGPLGFFLRRAGLASVMSLGDGGSTRRFPRGLVFHVPPANVDTLFVYSWALSALSGNPNLVRVSPRAAGAAELILAELNAVAETADPVVRQTQAMVTYGHDPAVTEAFSRACELRVIWGGDATVSQIRQVPLPAHARDLTFPDRSSFAALSVPAWLAAGGPERDHAADGFATDAYWFDQAACSSPRAVFLVGGDRAAALRVRDEFVARLREAVQARGFTVDPAMAVRQRVSGYGLAAAGVATEIAGTSRELLSIWLADPAAVPRRWLGAGVVPFAWVARLAELVPIIRRQDQTLAQFGFAHAELVEFATALGGRGLDRFVPLGSALSFGSVWDGYHLVREFTRLVTIDPGRTQRA